MMGLLPIWFCFWVLTPGVQDQAPPEEVIHVTLRPAAAPVPALKYQFLPVYRDQVSGNAVIHYHRAGQMIGKLPGPEDKLWQWLEMPSKDLPREEVRLFLQRYHNLFRELELASRCDRCDWEFRERIRTDALGLLLPDIQQLREFAHLLRLRAGLEIAEGRFGDAVRTLRIGFAMAKHANQSPTMIAALVGVAIANQMADLVTDLIQVPGAPNLYWAITDLPQPFIDLRVSLQSERMLVSGLFSPLAEAGIDIRSTPLSNQQLQVVIEGMGHLFDDGRSRETTSLRLALIGMTAKGYPEAKEFLLAQGMTAETVEAMPRLQVVLIFALAEYDRLFDEMIKWQGIPYWQARPGMAKADQGLREEKIKAGELGRIPLASYLIPAVQKVFFATTRLDRKLAALRSIEAIRLYAAGHDGKLPAALSEITEVPIPIDPVTGKEFDYKMEDGKAILSAPPPAGEQPRSGNYLKYELTLAK
jgi:hypothetical protein